MRVYVHPVLSEQEKSYFVTHADESLEFIFNNGSSELEQCKDVELAIGNFDTDWIGQMEHLKTILLDSVGTDNFNGYCWSTDSKITVHNLNDFFSVAVAEEVVANLLSIYRQLPALKLAQQQSLWVKDELRPKKRLVSDAKVLLVGYGNIGRQIEQLLTPFGCHISKFDQKEMRQGGKALLLENVSESDIIISTIPANTETLRIFDSALFSAMRPAATFLNVGRGQVVDEAALYAKAVEDLSFNACLDVTTQEPLLPDSNLWQLTNVHLTQHTGGGSMDENYKKIDIYISQIKRLLSNQPLNNTIQF